MKTIKDWLAQNNYHDVLKRIHAVEQGWKRKGTGTRRDWWEVLAGQQDGSPKKIEGKTFPVLCAARKRKGPRQQNLWENSLGSGSFPKL